MEKFQVTYNVQVPHVVEIEASNKAEAFEKARMFAWSGDATKDLAEHISDYDLSACEVSIDNITCENGEIYYS